MKSITVNLCDCHCKRKIRMIPKLGAFTESPAEVVKTPQFQFPVKRKVPIMAFTLTDSQKVTVSLVFQDKKHNNAVVDGSPQWGIDNSELIAITPSEDGMSCVVSAVGPLGTAMLSVTADADLGPGVKPIAGTLEIQITAGAATEVALRPGTPEEQETPEPPPPPQP